MRGKLLAPKGGKNPPKFIFCCCCFSRFKKKPETAGEPVKGYCTMHSVAQLLLWSQKPVAHNQKTVLALELETLFEHSKTIKKNLTNQKADCSLH